jgi:hypothetical protein
LIGVLLATRSQFFPFLNFKLSSDLLFFGAKSGFFAISV